MRDLTERAGDEFWVFDDPSVASQQPDALATTPAMSVVMPASRTTPMRATVSLAESLKPYVAGLVQRMFFSTNGSDAVRRSVMFAGVDAEHGSALLAAAVAEILASRGAGQVCLVDGNIRSPSLHGNYGVSNDMGVAQALAGTGSVRYYAQRLPQTQDGLWLLPAGCGPGGADACVTAEPAANRIRDLIAEFDYVVIDAPAVGRHAAASVFGAHVDAVVLVANANVTRRRAVRAAADTLRASGAHVFGTVLNNRTFAIPEAIYRRL